MIANARIRRPSTSDDICVAGWVTEQVGSRVALAYHRYDLLSRNCHAYNHSRKGLAACEFSTTVFFSFFSFAISAVAFNHVKLSSNCGTRLFLRELGALVMRRMTLAFEKSLRPVTGGEGRRCLPERISPLVIL